MSDAPTPDAEPPVEPTDGDAAGAGAEAPAPEPPASITYTEAPQFIDDAEDGFDQAPAGELEIELERLIEDVERLTEERDRNLDDAQRVAAEFANFRKATEKRQGDIVSQAAASLVEQLLPVLDACDSALQHGAEHVQPLRTMMVDILVKNGLEVIGTSGEAFDPNRHEAVAHEEGDGSEGPVVAEVLRTGYTWNQRVVRAAMVRVQG